jgi:hypothetical protein
MFTCNAGGSCGKRSPLHPPFTTMYSTALRHQLQVRRFTIRHLRPGWEVRDENDDVILKRVIYKDWHRVERAIAIFEQEEAELEAAGWVKIAS